MGMLKDIEERKFEKKVERLEELENDTLDKKAELMVHCSEMPDQFIEYTDFVPYNEGISDEAVEEDEEDSNQATIESPTGEPLKLSMYKTTNEEDMKLGIIGDKESTIGGLMDWIKYGNSSIGTRRNNIVVTSVLLVAIGSLIAWLWMSIQGRLEAPSSLLGSRVFLISATFTFTLVFSVFLMIKRNKSNNFLSGHLLCVGHSEGGELHYCIPLSNTDYMDYLTAWFGGADERVVSMLKQLSKKNMETIEGLEQDNRELRIKLEDERGRTYEKIADELQKNSVDYRRVEKQTKSKALLYSSVSVVVAVLVTVLVYQYVVI